MKPGTTIIWCGTQVQGREDKDVLGGTDSRQAVLAGCRQGQKLDAGSWGLGGREKMWAEPSFEKHRRGGEDVLKEVSGNGRIFSPKIGES